VDVEAVEARSGKPTQAPAKRLRAPGMARGPRPGWGWLLLLPSAVPLAVFLVFPIGYLAYLSLMQTSVITPNPIFVGLQNYLILFSDPLFWSSIWHTVLYMGAMLVVCVPLSLALALLLDAGLRGMTVYRALLFTPYAFPLVTSGIVFGWMFQSRGLVNWLFSLAHIGQANILGSGEGALVVVLLTAIWKFLGYYTIILFGGLASIPQAVKDAGRLDGARGWAYLWHVTLPMLSPSVFFVIVVTSIQSLQAFDQIYVLTEGGPGYSTTTLLYYIYLKGFTFFQFGQAASGSILLLIGIFALTLLQFWASRRWVTYEVV
jgi:multiple sugar transport system permease protein